MKTLRACLAIAAAFAVTASAQATPTAYSHPGTQNSETYTFTAQNDGVITAYFAGSTASYVNELVLLVDGKQVGTSGLDNHTSTYGQSFTFGDVTKGQTLVFELLNSKPSDIGPWYSDKSLNKDGVQHVYSYENYAGDANGIPRGTYVSFEDLPNGGDFNYFDESFVFTNVATVVDGKVPEPASLALLGLGALGLGISRRRARK